jgi:hypothetical protein
MTGKGRRAKGEKKLFSPFTPPPSPLYRIGSRETLPGRALIRLNQFSFCSRVHTGVSALHFSAAIRAVNGGTMHDRRPVYFCPQGVQWQGRGDLNSQPLVLETSALPIELHPWVNYLTIFVTTPEPTVRPPSRMAKRTLASIAIGEPSSIFSFTLSPGMHISAPPSKCAEPVTSVVRK